jgi:hypothetical protein
MPEGVFVVEAVDSLRSAEQGLHWAIAAKSPPAPGKVTNKNTSGLHNSRPAAVGLVAAWEGIWEERPATFGSAPADPAESSAGQTASLFQGSPLLAQEKKPLVVPKTGRVHAG